MRAIILVGGFGTRLRTMLTHVPKPMAPINSKPFLAYLLDYLSYHGITHVIFPVHYLREKIQDYFQTAYQGIQIDYVIEDEPLGTGGAILNALSYIKDKAQPIFVLNGDTFVKLYYKPMFNQHREMNATMTMGLRLIDDCSRYGKVVVEKNNIVEFREKGDVGAGWINAGVYLINSDLFSAYTLPKQFSFEKNFIVPFLSTIQPKAYMIGDYFIDIGIPDDYARAIQELPILVSDVSS
jgi:D-glycero-alpha-D-manno-heptose 1-phosphate guanylyltransferase